MTAGRLLVSALSALAHKGSSVVHQCTTRAGLACLQQVEALAGGLSLCPQLRHLSVASPQLALQLLQLRGAGSEGALQPLKLPARVKSGGTGRMTALHAIPLCGAGTCPACFIACMCTSAALQAGSQPPT